MFTFENIVRVATAAVGALVLTTMTVAAAVGPDPVTRTTPGNGFAAASQIAVHANV